jgi:hypothetical protein
VANVGKAGQSNGPPDPREWYRPKMLNALVVRDFTIAFRLLQKIGFSQQRIAVLTDLSQPEISAIIHGRRVMAYDVMRRIVDGLGIPPCLAGMSGCGSCVHHQCSGDQEPPPDVSSPSVSAGPLAFADSSGEARSPGALDSVADVEPERRKRGWLWNLVFRAGFIRAVAARGWIQRAGP